MRVNKLGIKGDDLLDIISCSIQKVSFNINKCLYNVVRGFTSDKKNRDAYKPVIELLIKNGAKLEINHLASLKLNDGECADLFLQYGWPFSNINIFRLALRYEHSALSKRIDLGKITPNIQYPRDYDIWVNETSSNDTSDEIKAGDTILHVLARAGRWSVVDKSFDASLYKDVLTTLILLQKGADFSIKNQRGETVADLWMKRTSPMILPVLFGMGGAGAMLLIKSTCEGE